jgi:hypothetical protein
VLLRHSFDVHCKGGEERIVWITSELIIFISLQ